LVFVGLRQLGPHETAGRHDEGVFHQSIGQHEGAQRRPPHHVQGPAGELEDAAFLAHDVDPSVVDLDRDPALEGRRGTQPAEPAHPAPLEVDLAQEHPALERRDEDKAGPVVGEQPHGHVVVRGDEVRAVGEAVLRLGVDQDLS
jgi:hypothetical protein